MDHHSLSDQLVELEQYTGLARFLDPIRFSYNSYFSAFFFSAGTMFFSLNKSAETLFRFVFSAKLTEP